MIYTASCKAEHLRRTVAGKFSIEALCVSMEGFGLCGEAFDILKINKNSTDL